MEPAVPQPRASWEQAVSPKGGREEGRGGLWGACQRERARTDQLIKKSFILQRVALSPLSGISGFQS